jgi:hypothetical protein
MDRRPFIHGQLTEDHAMETASPTVIPRPELVASRPGPTAEGSRMLTVAAVYHLSETGRKALLLQGGDGHTVQRLQVSVPANRLHLVAVSARGEARLRLSPRFEVDEGQRIRRIEEPPSYDAPPTIDQLFKDAARNHELERAYQAERSAWRSTRRDTERTWRNEVAAGFLADPAQRAMVHPAPSPTQCVLVTSRGRVQFDAHDEDIPARDVPAEAHRRFRADLQQARVRTQTERTEGLRLHDERKAAIASWVNAHGSPEQRARHAAGLLPMDEAIEAMTDEAFAPLAVYPRYVRDGGLCLQAFLRQSPRYADAVVTPTDFRSTGRKAVTSTAAQWARLQEMQAAAPAATIALHVRELTWLVDPKAPRLIQHTLVVTQTVGVLVLRREYHAPNTEETH